MSAQRTTKMTMVNRQKLFRIMGKIYQDLLSVSALSLLRSRTSATADLVNSSLASAERIVMELSLTLTMTPMMPLEVITRSPDFNVLSIAVCCFAFLDWEKNMKPIMTTINTNMGSMVHGCGAVCVPPA